MTHAAPAVPATASNHLTALPETLSVLMLLFVMSAMWRPGSLGAKGIDFLRRYRASLAVLTTSMVATGLMWSAARSNTVEQERSNFDRDANLLRHALLDQVEGYQDSLGAVRIAYQALGKRGRRVRKRFLESVGAQDLPPGVELITFLQARPDAQPKATDASKMGGAAGVRPMVPWKNAWVSAVGYGQMPAGQKEENVEDWLASLGPLRHAIERSRDTGRAQVSATVRAESGGVAKGPFGGETAFFVTLPIFREAVASQTVEQRRASIQGWLSAFVTVTGMVEAVKSDLGTAIGFQLYDGSEIETASLLYDSRGDQRTRAEEDRPHFLRRIPVQIGEHSWTLLCSSPVGATTTWYQNYAARVLLTGFLATALLFGIVLRLDRKRMGSQQRASDFARRFEESEARLNTERERQETALRESEERYVLASHAAHDGLWDWDLRTNEVDFSTRWKALLGFAEEELGSDPDEWFSRVHPEDQDRLNAKLSEHLQGLTPRFEFEHRVLHRDGTYRWMLSKGLAARDEEGKARRIAGSLTDITAHRQAEKRLLYAALHDPLTGLPNRSYFMERLANASRKARKNPNYLFALLFLDVDRFKVVNDSLGHVVGDELLVSIARRLKTCLRPSDTIARLGGDEFAILLDKLGKDIEATYIADRIQKELALPFKMGDQEVFTAVSIGITFSSAGQSRAEDLLRNADTAMYRAKAHGKARYELFDQGMQAHSLGRLHLETDLRRGLERGELLIYYQPIASLSSGQITGCEALIRWQHPERGLVLPDEFVPLAEETGLIVPLSGYVLQTACRQMVAWQRAGLPQIQLSVNVSPRQFKQQDVAKAVNEALAESQLDPALLQLELTESALMEHAETTIKPLIELYGQGVQISLDDFGTGYSSLIYLRRFPISILKISESFIRQITTHPGDAAVASGLIALAHSLDLTVIVEGVETPEQLAFLHAKNCEAVQGHVVSPPLDAERFALLLRQWRGLSVPV